MDKRQGNHHIADLCACLDKGFRLYPESVHELPEASFCIARLNGVKRLLIAGATDRYNEFEGELAEANGVSVRICPMNTANSAGIRKWFSFTNPVSGAGRHCSIGLGDRLGVASAGHLSLIRQTDVFPVLAQQSVRELTATNRSFDDVLAAAVWAVFQEGYRGGYGADGDHLKTLAEVRQALDCGFTMITLDCSEYIHETDWNDETVQTEYLKIGLPERQRWERTYLNQAVTLTNGYSLRFSEEMLKRIALTYQEALRFTAEIYHTCIAKYPRPVDFEMSVDEISQSTSPQAHYFIASELANAGVQIASLAPRFCGEFQKGIDYRGDVRRFEEEFGNHACVADLLGHKLSVHSGSDKYTVFPIIGEKSGGRYHLKTSGTNWLEALRLIAEKSPGLFREILDFAVTRFEEARKFYKVSADAAKVPKSYTLPDGELRGLLDDENARQVLHITYGFVLRQRDEFGRFRFRDRIYSVFDRYENEYGDLLHHLIQKHLMALGAI